MAVLQWTGSFRQGNLIDVGTPDDPNPAEPRIAYAGLRSSDPWRGTAQDQIRGTDRGDILFLDGGGGVQLIKGIGGFFLGGGNDALDFTSPTMTYGSMRVSAGTGNDVVLVNDGDDRVFGGAGNDRIKGHAGNDSLDGGDGADNLVGGIGSDSLVGGTGSDVLVGLQGDDRLAGDAAGAGAGADSLFGGAGDDRMFGGAGADVIYGGAGRDRIDGGAGSDLYFGGFGADVFVTRAVDDPAGPDEVRFFATDDRIAIPDFGATQVFNGSLPAGFRNACLIFDSRSGMLFADTNGVTAGGRTALIELEGLTSFSIDSVLFL